MTSANDTLPVNEDGSVGTDRRLPVVAPKDEPPRYNGPTHTRVRLAGDPRLVPIIHVSRQTLNRPHSFTRNAADRAAARVRRKRRMRLRKLRGWH